METVIASLISAGLALIGTVITVNASQRKTQEAVENTMKTELAVMNNELKHLREEVEKHNNFAVRVPRLKKLCRLLKMIFILCSSSIFTRELLRAALGCEFYR